MTGTRIDKWLWAARFYKTRALAAKACELGRVQLNGQDAKPARAVKEHDVLTVRNDTATYTVEVRALAEMRGSASVAQTLYAETEASKAARAAEAEQRRLHPEFFAPQAPAGRPSKRDRRLIHSFRGEY